ncbi:MAG TPA: sulfatase-like hydrolase/transferase, partial [Spirochaetota bacterium]|nr:sulfatase-like hydrolase/transferase [Spirochaetota bacterium]
FDNTLNAMRKAGFAEIHSYKEFKRKEDSPHIWGWGVEDGTFYKRFFEYLDADHARHPGSPVFATLATVGTHIPCTGMPDYPDRMIRDPKNIRERYINALRLSDSHLRIFFNEIAKRGYLSNSVIILTSDHSFPMREHGIYNNEICRYEESFRIPFLMIWNGKISGNRIKGKAYSQLDIGPTVCDIIGIEDTLNTMQGTSILRETARHPIPLVQPYNGMFLEAVDWPYKYVKHLRTDEEFLYDLAADPEEKTDRAKTDPERVRNMRSLLDPVYITQKSVEENKVRK